MTSLLGDTISQTSVGEVECVKNSLILLNKPGCTISVSLQTSFILNKALKLCPGCILFSSLFLITGGTSTGAVVCMSLQNIGFVIMC